jgi:protein-S-isoprenylcysteine O-methyltransferase Ste14
MNSHISKNLTPTQVDHTVRWELTVAFVLLVVLIGMVPFAAAGRFDWWQGWVYSSIMVGTNFVSRYLLYRKNPELLAERFHFTTVKGAEKWDKLIAPLIGLVGPLLVLVVAGLDKRNAWSPDVAFALQIIAIVLFLLSGAFGVWAMLENPYFTSVVRIQKDRGQKVITTGPYRFIRHPAYWQSVVWWLITPVILGTLWALIPALLMIVGIIVRTVLEDRTLQAELAGYTEYAQHVRYRLLPGVW